MLKSCYRLNWAFPATKDEPKGDLIGSIFMKKEDIPGYPLGK